MYNYQSPLNITDTPTKTVINFIRANQDDYATQVGDNPGNIP